MELYHTGESVYEMEELRKKRGSDQNGYMEMRLWVCTDISYIDYQREKEGVQGAD